MASSPDVSAKDAPEPPQTSVQEPLEYWAASWVAVTVLLAIIAPVIRPVQVLVRTFEASEQTGSDAVRLLTVWLPVKVLAASVRASVAEVVGKVIVVESVPASVSVLLAVSVFPFAIVSIAEVAGAVIVTLLMLVAVATPIVGVTSVGEPSKTNFPVPEAPVEATPSTVTWPVTPSVPASDIFPEASSVEEPLGVCEDWLPAPVMIAVLVKLPVEITQVAQAMVPVVVMVPPVMGDVVAIEVTPAVFLISSSQRLVAPCLSVAYWPVAIVKEVAPSVAVPPSRIVKVSDPVRLKVSVPAPSFSTVVTSPGQPDALDSGTVTAAAPDWKRMVCPRSIVAVPTLSQAMV